MDSQRGRAVPQRGTETEAEHPAVEVVGRGPGPVVLSCEHASNAFPEPWVLPEEDRWIAETHWAWDLGAAAVTRAVAEILRAPAVLARFSRLLVDPNRDLDSPTLFRDRADGRLVHLNREVTPREREARLSALYVPYHATLERVVRASPGALLFSVHSFTPVYEGGAPREMELGVLFDRDRGPGLALAAALAARGWRTAINEPYSGQAGMMYSAQTHADREARVALEIEIRQDLCADPVQQRRVGEALAGALVEAGLLGSP